MKHIKNLKKISGAIYITIFFASFLFIGTVHAVFMPGFFGDAPYLPITSDGHTPIVSISCTQPVNTVYIISDGTSYGKYSVEADCEHGFMTIPAIDWETSIWAGGHDGDSAETHYTLYVQGGECSPFNIFNRCYDYQSFAGGNVFLRDENGAWKTTTIVPPYSNVLFIPGLEASRLYKQRDADCTINCEDQLWEPNGNSDVEALYLNADGTSKNSDIYTRDIIKETNTPIWMGLAGQNIYKSFSNMMDGLVHDGKISNWRAFAYDWRLSPENTVNTSTRNYNDEEVSLTSTLRLLIESSRNGKVTIIAHSNGGLVTKVLLKKLEEDKAAGKNNLIDYVDTVILVAVPEIGTASAVPALLHGFDQQILGQGWLMDELHARELGKNMPSAYGLLPSKEYINHVSASPVTFVGDVLLPGPTMGFVKNYGSAINSYEEYKNFLFGKEGRSTPVETQTKSPISISESLFGQAENLHNSLDFWTPPSSLRVVEMAGWGLDTVASFEYYPRYTCLGNTGPDACATVLDERPRFTGDGDKRVVVPSAHYMSFLGSAEKYWVNISEHNKQLIFGARKNREHSDILEISELDNLINEIIANDPVTTNSVITDTQPIDTENRLRLNIQSPVTLDAYDADGNHTGKICSPDSDFCYVEESIPNSAYLEFGEGKYLNLPEDGLQKVTLQGTDIGTFTFNSELVAPSGQTTTFSFVDIPVTTQTQAEVTFNTAGTPQLALDVTGDGITDVVIVPGNDFDPVTYLQTMKTTIDSLDLTQAKKNAFDKRVDNIIKAIQKNKIDKAKLRADRFKTVLEKRLSKPDSKKPKLKKLSKTDAQLLLDILNQLLDNIG